MISRDAVPGPMTYFDKFMKERDPDYLPVAASLIKRMVEPVAPCGDRLP